MHNVYYQRTDKGDDQVNPGYHSKVICGKHFLDKISKIKFDGTPNICMAMQLCISGFQKVYNLGITD